MARVRKFREDVIAQLPLGKKAYQPDPRSLNLAEYIRSEIHVPGRFDFDKYRRPLPLRAWGNTEWQNSVIAAQANHLLRLGRVERNSTLLLTDKDAISRYRSLSGAVAPGDTRDQGLSVLEAMRDWQREGWKLDTHTGPKNYKISVYGELEANDPLQLRAGCYVFHGIHLGFWLPQTAQVMTAEGIWDYDGQSGADWRPGSWGGQLAYCKAYDEASFEILVWGTHIHVSNEFVAHYADEAWTCIEIFSDWRIQQAVEIEVLCQRLQQISGKVNE
jgi:hypothetical protein